MALCKAKAKSTGNQCGNLAIIGGTVCRIHGGSAAHVKAKAAERVTEHKARGELGKLDSLLGPAEPVENPLLELQSLAGEAKRWKELMSARVAGLTSVGYQGPTGEQVKAEVALLERAMDRMVHVLGIIAKLNIDERLMRIDQEQAQRMSTTLIEALDAVLGWLGLTSEHFDEARGIVAKRIGAATRGENPPPLPPKLELYRDRVVHVPAPMPPRLERRALEAPKRYSVFPGPEDDGEPSGGAGEADGRPMVVDAPADDEGSSAPGGMPPMLRHIRNLPGGGW